MIRDSVGDRLRTVGGHPTGFDYLRLFLAISILAWHCVGYTDSPTVAVLAFAPLVGVVASLVPMFFGLSGFLVASSLERTKSLATFGGLRVMRIFPALAVDTVISALVLGPLLTDLP